MSTRRTILRTGLATAAAGTVGGLGQWARALAASAAPAGAPLAAGRTPATPTPFAVPLPVPPELRPVRRTASTDHYSVAMVKSRSVIVPGTSTEVLTYNGSFPGPTIRAKSGRRVVVEQRNCLDMPVSVHLHGASVPADSDGSSMATIRPGGTRTYTYPNLQPATTLWMHDHAHHMEAEHVYRGLAGLYLIEDQTEAALRLPSGRYEVPLVLRDAHLDERAQLVFTMDDPVNRSVILVNGRPWPYLRVQARKYRFRMVNASNLRIFVLCLSDGSEIVQIGSDGGLLERPARGPVLALSPGERADFVIDFSRYSPGTQVVLQNLIGPGPVEQVGQVMRFDVGGPAPDPSVVPETLVTLPVLPAPTVERSFVLNMDEPGTGDRAYINGQVFDPDRIDTTVPWGSSEVWTVTNASTTVPHNFHLHLVQFRLLERDGVPAVGAEAGQKDTVLLFPGQTAKLHVHFASYRGVYPYHCHMIDHSAMGMMAQMRIG